MATAAGFVQTIRESPEDDAPRLVYADWLEERDDPLGEFIRVQCEFEPVRGVYGQPRPDELRERERKLLLENKEKWLGPLAALEKEWEAGFEASFRRGFADSVGIRVGTFLDHAEELGQWCPLLREITFYDVRDNGAALAGARALRNYRHLQIADWPTEQDALALAGSSNLANVERLTLWLGSEHSEAVALAFARSRAMKGLREIVLLQLYGSREVTEDQLDAQADAIAAAVNRGRRKKRARVEKPFRCLFPLAAYVGYGIYAGTLPDGRLAVVQPRIEVNVHDRRKEAYVLSVFDQEGNHLGDSLETLQTKLVREPEHSFEHYNKAEFLDVLRKEIGFTPGLIRVKKFACDYDLSELTVYRFDDLEVLASPDTLPPYHTEPRWSYAQGIHSWLERGDFVVYRNNHYFAGPDGEIHSS
jgi:uncharacterized protein (TIGR02996 family)